MPSGLTCAQGTGGGAISAIPGTLSILRDHAAERVLETKPRDRGVLAYRYPILIRLTRVKATPPEAEQRHHSQHYQRRQHEIPMGHRHVDSTSNLSLIH